MRVLPLFLFMHTNAESVMSQWEGFFVCTLLFALAMIVIAIVTYIVEVSRLRTGGSVWRAFCVRARKARGR